MSATAGADPPADPDGLSDHEYFQAIEETFLRLRGSPLLLSPKDWRTAQRWRREGIPLDLVRRSLEEVFERRRARGEEGKVSSLGYCAGAVESAWRELRELTATGRGAPAAGEPEPLDVAARLEALAGSLPEGLPSRDALARRIRELGSGARSGEGPDREPGPAPDPQAVEEGLAALEEEAVSSILEGLGPKRRSALEEETERTLAVLADRVPREEAGRSRERLLRQKVRRAVGLPTLSLFAPEAEW